MCLLIADVRFVQWVYLWEKLCEQIRGLFPSFEQLLFKFSIIWTCYLCDLLPSCDSLCYLWLDLSCFWWCMLRMHENIVEKNETNDFCWRVFLSFYLVFDCCWFWVGCHVGRMRASAHFRSINLWNPKKLFIYSAGIDVVIWCRVSEMFTWSHYLSILLELATWKNVSINTCFPSPRCIWNTFIQVIVLITPYLRWCISDDC